MNLSPLVAFVLFPAMLILIEGGRRLRFRHQDSTGNNAIEGAVFGLFGLLLAFTFSGAMSRYDSHRQLLSAEINDIGTAYLRLDLLPQRLQPEVRHLFRSYTSSRLNLFSAVADEVSPLASRLQHEIWEHTLVAVASPGASPDAAKLLIPALNEMFDITVTRQTAFNMHPPTPVFLLLFVFTCASAFLAGYSSQSQVRNWVYMIVLSLSITFTVYATLEIEYPRQGLIRFTELDRSLITLRDSMK
jgi:hypothetical protein